jgi:hypothetical protein
LVAAGRTRSHQVASAGGRHEVDPEASMDHSQEQRLLRDALFRSLLEAALPLKGGPDPELTLELLIEATELLQDHLEHELEELRLEQAE